MTYQLTACDSILRVADCVWIPPRTTHNTQTTPAYLAWLEAGDAPSLHRSPSRWLSRPLLKSSARLLG
jgi:hypothetical protein